MKYRVLFATPLGLIPAVAANTANAAPPTPVFNWSGFYVGAHLGALSDQSRQTAFQPAPGGAGNYCFGGGGGFGVACEFDNKNNALGVLGGVQIGYNFQNGMWVYGGELDFSLSSASKTRRGLNGGGYAFLGDWTAKTGVEALGTARLRLGYTFTPNTLVYATGGLAYAKTRNSFNPATVAAYSWADTDWRAGFTVGGGLEYMLSRNVSIKGEALYYDLGNEDHVMNGGGTQFGLTDKVRGVVARIGINYLFH